MARITVPEADAVIDEAFTVLDKGFVRLVDYLGGDARVVQAARVSYGTGTKTVREDQGLINYLMRNAHTSPFEQVTMVFHIKLPLFVFAQLVRTRTAKLNAQSARYSVMEEEFYFPGSEGWRGQSTGNRQVADQPLPYAETKTREIEYDQEVGRQVRAMLESVGREPLVPSSEDHPTSFTYSTARSRFEDHCRVAYCEYEDLLDEGVGREQARMVLPQNLYTQIYWKIDLHNLFHFLRLRLDWHAQQEIRAYAEVFAELARKVAPMCYEAFEEHVLKAQRFGATEVAALNRLLAGQPHGLEGRAAQEFEAKLEFQP